MIKRLPFLAVLAASAILFGPSGAVAQRLMEKLDRGVVGIRQTNGDCFVSWRLLGTDPDDIAFNVYRASAVGSPVKLNSSPLSGPTFLVDKSFKANEGAEYFVRPVVGGAEQEPSARFAVPKDAPTQYLSVPMQTPEGYSPNDASVGDLDGDGQYEIVLHQAGRAHDNSHGGETDPPILQAYKLDGKLLWQINLGKNIRDGAHYTQFMVYDLDGDGKAEVACKTADGSVDGKGKVIGDPKANWVNKDGRILEGPEFLTVFDGLTGAELATTDYIPPRHPRTEKPSAAQLNDVWGDGYGNRVDRFLACVAYLDGKRPSLVMCRGYYTRTVLAAWNWRGGKLEHLWTFDSTEGPAKNRKFAGQGNHGISVADVDGDGKDEIVYGGMTVDDDGKGLWTSGLGHGDAMHVSDLNPNRPGLEIFRIQEPVGDAGAHMFDAATGEVLWKKPTKEGSDEGPGRGLAIDIDPRHKGMESWVAGGGIPGLFDCEGKLISEKTPGACNFGIWWDGDFLREILDRTWIAKWNWKSSSLDRLLTAEDVGANNGTKATPCLSGDILGDWREEVTWRSSDGKELRIYSTTEPTEHRLFTLMHDPQYRLSIAWQNVSYNQPPHTSFYLGADMEKPPRPKITTSLDEAPAPAVEPAEPKTAASVRTREAASGALEAKLQQLIARRDAQAAIRKQIDELRRQPRALLVVKPYDSAAIVVRAQNALTQDNLVVADLGDGKRGMWQQDAVVARLPWYTAEELKSGALDLVELIGLYEDAVEATPAVREALAPDIEVFKNMEREPREKWAAFEQRVKTMVGDGLRAHSVDDIKAIIAEAEVLQQEIPARSADIAKALEPLLASLQKLEAGLQFVDGEWITREDLALRDVRAAISGRPLAALVATQSEVLRTMTVPLLIAGGVLVFGILLLIPRGSRTLGIIVLLLTAGAIGLCVHSLRGSAKASRAAGGEGDAHKVLRILLAGQAASDAAEGRLTLTNTDLDAFLDGVVRIEGEPAADGSLYRTALAGRFTRNGLVLSERMVRNGAAFDVDYEVGVDLRAPRAPDSVTVGGLPAPAPLATLLWSRLSEALAKSIESRPSALEVVQIGAGTAELKGPGLPAQPEPEPAVTPEAAATPELTPEAAPAEMVPPPAEESPETEAQPESE